ncbi:sugar phosphate isomerase/epimerase family protein [Alienimonas californiensis]|uniref:Xylose isomerase-like TIM barrel n=1 Tax=Alienimonas californiensis TaxID=2527989 RepID=A0A517PD12_9PLAN|nr:sugar phosphate isomerase/epimerase family protein [Alienimonas californiensis]QDT17256.1 Xylose isomerase-like TIM barrel [Alienimonas californiensis]
MQRRTFLAGSAAALAAASTLRAAPPAAVTEFPEDAARYRKAVKLSMISGEGSLEEKFAIAKAAGFAGIEIDSSARDVSALLAARDAVGLPIHGVVYGDSWKDRFSAADAAVRARAVAGLQQALRDCEQLGGSSVLVIPGVVDEDTGYADAYARAELEIAKALPVAEETGVDVLFENVWNNFLLSPLEFARFIDGFDSPAVGAYFDVGNVVRIGWPEQWIAVLGDRIRKLDVKEYSRKLQQSDGLYKGFGVELGEGSVDWDAVRAALETIGYRGWATAEVRGGDLDRLTDVANRMNAVLGLESA